MSAMDDKAIRDLALAKGFKLKEQPDGSLDLNPYVYEFARALLGAATPTDTPEQPCTNTTR